MKLIQTCAVLLVCGSLAACGTMTNETLEQDGAETKAVVDATLGTVYARLVSASRPCLSKGGLVLENEYLPELNSARVTAVYRLGGAGNKPISTARLKAISATQTEVTVNYYMPPLAPDGWQWLATSTIEWAKAGAGQCKWAS
jgi:hypothetical protein